MGSKEVADEPFKEEGQRYDVEADASGNLQPKQTARQAQESAEETHEANIVWWSGDNDPENPMNWSATKKWSNIAVLSAVTFLTPLASSMFAPGVPQVMEEFHSTSDTLATFVVSIFVLGFAVGPLFLAPLSELYGRIYVYNTCNVLFTILTVGCALATTLSMLVAFRFLAGVAGVAVVTCGSGTIADMIPREQRGRAMSLWSLGPLLGPIIGPVAGGFLIESKGWRWSFWVIVIVSGAFTVMGVLVWRESYAPVLLERKAVRLRKETGNKELRSKFVTGQTRREIFSLAIVRPVKMLLFFPIVTLMCIYVAVMYGLLYILFTTFTFVYRDQYGFTSSSAGLSFMGAGVGTILGLFYCGLLSDRNIKKVSRVKGVVEPEDRLPFILTVPSAFFLPAGLFIYGWTASKHVHWIVPMLGNGVTGFGMIGMLMMIQTYLVDAYPLYAASVIAASAVLRSLLGALLPLCGLQVYNSLGLGWGNSLLGFIALGMMPVPLLFKVYGKRIRKMTGQNVKL